MLEEINNLFRKIFSNEETLVFASLLTGAFLIIFFLGNILTPFFISIIFAYLLVGLQNRLEGFGFNSGIALALTYSFFLLLGIAFLVWLGPLVYQQVNALVVAADDWIDLIPPIATSLAEEYPQLQAFSNVVGEEFNKELLPDTNVILQTLFGAISTGVTLSVNLILLPILVFFFLFDRKSIISSFLSVLPQERAMLQQVWVEMDDQLSNYVRGKALEIVIVGSAAALIFMYFDLQYIALLSILVGFSVLIPFLGAFIVTLPVAVLGLVQFGLTFDFWLLMGVYLILQILDGYLLVPILFSDAVKLHPVVIMLAVFVFGAMFGFWGVFFAIPIATLIKAIWNSWPERLSN
ncbi:AI-2E family transporter [Gammaproteobacteria bacterium]|nr:AI-2E family transporter [Gammaproteobacteria bacterium]